MHSAANRVIFRCTADFSCDIQVLNQPTRITPTLHTPSLQSPGERMALAADLAQHWASQRGRP
ncbi:hypothetical protein ACYZT3_19095 [Pseudomonas sp. MDT1-16]|uniref:hypothetical protein n=1 Tax=Pseudomonas sp. AL03 TaxID=3042230 RepID=UPI00249CBB66|nr:hypothetical protein [Pseudomonas sp. AL03]MDI3272113.1 hypothetical protein [Pseudomonas sp. AL03]